MFANIHDVMAFGLSRVSRCGGELTDRTLGSSFRRPAAPKRHADAAAARAAATKCKSN